MLPLLSLVLAVAPELPERLPAPPKGFDAPRAGVARGTVETIEYPSKTVGEPRKAVVYRPPGHAKDKAYPALYLLHGIGDDETGWTMKGNAAAVLDNLHADGRVVPMIVVMPNGRAGKGLTPRTPWKEQFPAFEAFERDLLDDLIPFVEKQYATKPGPANRALAGLSMGGGQSLNFGLTHPETFAWVGGFASAPNTKPAGELVKDPAAAARAFKLVWVSCGDKDGLLKLSRQFHEDLTGMKVPHAWHVSGGNHEWAVWKTDLYYLAPLLFRDGK